jgi:hypothetical protein
MGNRLDGEVRWGREWGRSFHHPGVRCPTIGLIARKAQLLKPASGLLSGHVAMEVDARQRAQQSRLQRRRNILRHNTCSNYVLCGRWL